MTKKVNCIIVDDEHVAREILQVHISKIEKLELVAICKNALEAFNAVNNFNVDLVFLDINMPEISGLSFARAVNKNVSIIFTTAYREYAVDGFDLQAVDYLLKPISFERFFQAINKYLNENNVFQASLQNEVPEEKQESFFVRADRKMIKIQYDEISFVESLADYIKIHLKDKIVITRETISNIEAKLPQNDFIRTHRSYIVAKRVIDSFTHELVEIGKKQIPISRGYKKEVLEKLGNS
jgi:DNA-binding LytR/AlgR family response regulator